MTGIRKRAPSGRGDVGAGRFGDVMVEVRWKAIFRSCGSTAHTKIVEYAAGVGVRGNQTTSNRELS